MMREINYINTARGLKQELIVGFNKSQLENWELNLFTLSNQQQIII